MTVLYKADAKGIIRIYEIFPFEEGYMVVWGHLHGNQQEKYTEVFENESGRLHYQQVKLEIESRIVRQKAKGYKESVEDAMKGSTNAMGFKKPMLASPYKRTHIPTTETVFIQRKYDGHRCLMINDGKKIIAYSRNGKTIKTAQHITTQLDLPVGAVLDGELYIHGMTLQKISSLVRKLQPGNSLLKYYVYDLMSDDTYAVRRQALLDLAENDRLGEHVVLAPTRQCVANATLLRQETERAITEGYEGLIIRRDERGYEDGVRSKSLIKYKMWLDDDFVIKDIVESKDGWAVLVFDNFAATAPGSHEEKVEILENADQYIGKKARVEYARLTDKGVPFHPIATCIHEE